jgi:hypothetical protein
MQIAGKDYVVALPDFAVREELVAAYADASKRGGSALMRAYGAFLGLCCPLLGKAAGADYQAARFDPLAYGGRVYGYLREKGVTPADVSAAAVPIVVQVVEATFPRQSEVDAALGNSPAEGVP